MSNYAERLAYWFLRLNGFFVLENYVIDSYYSRAEHDLLAVRPPNAEEEVSGAKVEPHDLFREGDKLGVSGSVTLGLVVQVKGGKRSSGRKQYPGDAFSERRMRHALQRAGITRNEKEREEAVSELCAKRQPRPLCAGENFAFAKLFIATRPPASPRGYFSASLDDVGEYVRCRLRAVAIKERHWLYFHDPIVQYIIFEESKSDTSSMPCSSNAVNN